MSSQPTVLVHRDQPTLAAAVAARLVTRLVDVQAARGQAAVVLSGGGIGTAVLAALRKSPACAAIDWHRLDIYWGDERFLASGHPERNESQARAALLDHVDVDPARVWPMGADGGADGHDPEAVAARYAAVLATQAAPEDHGGVPRIDVLLLGLGAEGHIASIFPESPAIHDQRTVVAVRGCPKPPPVRITLTLPAINAATEVWVIAAGAEKAGAANLALQGAGSVQVPAAGARGRTRTLWLLDEAAAGALPKGLRRIASP